jgi:hypothetical protein
MSPRATDSGKPSGPFRKPRADLYTMMLLVALLALVIGTVFLYLEVQRLESRAQAPGPSGDDLLTLGLADAGVTAFQRSTISFVRDLETTVG